MMHAYDISWLFDLIAERDEEIARLVHMLSGRTMSCELCNGNTARVVKLEATLLTILRVAKLQRYDEAGLIPMVEEALR